MPPLKNKKNTFGFVVFHTLGWIFLALFRLPQAETYTSLTFSSFCICAVLALFFMLKQAFFFRRTEQRKKSAFFFFCFFLLTATYIFIALKEMHVFSAVV